MPIVAASQMVKAKSEERALMRWSDVVVTIITTKENDR